MTLRARLAAITTALLAIVLTSAGVALERLAAKDMERALENRARERARGPLSGPPTGSASGSASDSGARPSSNGPRPTSTDDSGRPPMDEPPPRADEPPLDGEPPPPPPPDDPNERPPDEPATRPLDTGGGVTMHRLPPELDEASVEVFQFQPQSGFAPGAPILRSRATTGSPHLTEADARARMTPRRTSLVDRVEIRGSSWIVAQDFAPSFDLVGRRPEPPPVAGFRGERRPPPAPPARRVIAIAFVDTGPAQTAHRSFVLRLSAIGLSALVVGGLLAYVLARRMLRPVARAARAAESIEHSKERLPAPNSNDELGRLVAVLNGMLARLEAASDRERLFLATASHELRRPLTALLGELELASAAGRSPGELRSSIDLARGDANAMGRLVDDILHHARARAGSLPLVENDVTLPALVADAVTRSRRSIPRPVDVRVDGVPDLVVRADADLLRRALENLVVNAAVHGGEGVCVVVRGEADATGVRIHVDDDGPGIPSDELRTIFDPFGRGDRARTVPGFGLGLVIARDVARAHGGDLTVLSPRPGADAARPGSRFTLTLGVERGAREVASDSSPVANS